MSHLPLRFGLCSTVEKHCSCGQKTTTTTTNVQTSKHMKAILWNETLLAVRSSTGGLTAEHTVYWILRWVFRCPASRPASWDLSPSHELDATGVWPVWDASQPRRQRPCCYSAALARGRRTSGCAVCAAVIGRARGWQAGSASSARFQCLSLVRLRLSSSRTLLLLLPASPSILAPSPIS